MLYKFPIYVPGIAVVIAIVAAAIGVVLLRKQAPGIFTFMALGFAALAGGVITPMLALDRVVLDDLKLEQTTGFWFAPTVKGFLLDEVESVTIGVARDRKKREYEVWIVKMKNGDSREINPGDLWEMNGPDIIPRLQEKGITVEQ
jgi:hypothetical protein